MWHISVFFLALLLASLCGAEEARIAAAADLQFALREVAGRFERDTGNTVRLTFGSSGNLYAQITNGAPFDVFLSADSDYPRRLVDSGKADGDSLVVYARGRIVLWVPRSSGLDINRGLSILLEPAVRKVALANPQHAPYGRAAVAALRHLGLYDGVKGKFVLGENVLQAMQFARSGSVDAGFVALSLALAPAAASEGRYWVVPQEFYPTIDQSAVVVSASARKKAALAFLEYLRKPDVVDLMGRYGFQNPGGK